MSQPTTAFRATAGRIPRGLIVVLLAALALLAPAAASAATTPNDRWVDAETGSDAGNDCDEQATPCATISQAIDTGAGAIDDVIHVDDGVYSITSSINVGGQKSVIADDFESSDSGGTEIVKTGAGSAVFPSAGALMTGFEISAADAATVAIVADEARFEDNTVTADAPNSTALLVFDDTAVATDNVLIADDGDEDIGIQINGGVTGGEVTGNRIGEATAGFYTGIKMQPGPSAAATIEGNTILGMRQDGGLRGRGIELNDVHDVTLTANRIASPSATGTSYGIEVDVLDPGATVAMRRNEIVGMSTTGVLFLDTAGSATMEGDLIAGGAADAMYAGNVESLSLINTTIYGNAEPMRLENANVAIDSSILGEQIASNNGTVCEITYSRGTSTTPGGDGCADFQTDAAPGFVSTDPASLDLHLTADSPLIDAGNPATPGAAIDIDGDGRALEGDGECPIDAERDMGYDEVVVELPDCPDPEPEPEPEPGDTMPPNTKVKGKKKQEGSRAVFTLVSTEADSTFECRIDRGEFAPCKPEFRTRKLNRGRHTLFVRATDAAGNTDLSPKAKKFKLVRKAR
jgi:hypothetical protein